MVNVNITDQIRGLLRDGCVIVDFETTGFPKDPKVEIIEIGILSSEGEILMNTLVKPKRPIPYGASRVNNIFDHDVRDAPPFEDVYPQMAAILNHARAVAYNHEFEQGILRTVCHSHGQAPITSDWFCAMRGYMYSRGSRSFTKLTTACMNEGIVVSNAHRALGDCAMTLALMRKLADITA